MEYDNFGQENIFSAPLESTALSISFEVWMLAFFIAFITALLIIFSLRIIRFFITRNEYNDHTVYLVRLPKDRDPSKSNQEYRLEELHEEIARAETIFASIGGLPVEKGLKTFIFGRKDNFSFELVASQSKIAFYVISPQKYCEYIEQQIQAHYPAATMEPVSDYNIFSPKSESIITVLKTKRVSLFPIKTYKSHDTDPMNALINVLSKLKENEGLAIQYCVQSAKKNWHRKSSELVQKAHELNSLEKALRTFGIIKVLHWIGDLINFATPQKDQNQFDRRGEQRGLTAMESEALKGIEEKNSKAGLNVNIRIVVSAITKEQARIYLQNITNAFSQYNSYEYGNSIINRPKAATQRALMKRYIYRYFNPRESFLLNTEELASLFHFPLKNAETPNILWLEAKLAPAPNNVPTNGILLGHNVYRGIKKPIHILPEDRLRHMYIIGKSGGGKSVFMGNIAIQDVLNGDGVCVLDPHGDFVDEVLRHVPPERAEDVIIFDPSDLERPLGLNLLEYDPKYPEQKSFAINEMIGVLDKLYDLKTSGGPMFELYMRNAMLLVMDDPTQGATLMDIPSVLANAEFRKARLEKCKDPTVVAFWREQAEKAGGEASLENIVPYITSKLTQFISNDMMRPIIGQQKSAFNFREIMDNQKILLVKLSKGTIGDMNAYLLGMIIVGKILMAALSRTNLAEDKRVPFYLHIDEFQNFTTNSIATILSEARKYGLGLTVVHQYIGQLTANNDTTIKDAVFGNVGTIISLRVGSEDAEFLEKEFAPVFNQFDLVNVEMFTSYIKLLAHQQALKPFSMKNPPPRGPGNPELVEKIRTLSRLKYGKHKEIIEAEINQKAANK